MDSHDLYLREADARERLEQKRSARALHLLALVNAAYLVESAKPVWPKTERYVDLGMVSDEVLDVVDRGEEIPEELAQEIERELAR